MLRAPLRHRSIKQNIVLFNRTFCTAQHRSIILDAALSGRSGHMSTDRVEAVERALAVLDAFLADRAEMTLAEIAAATGFYKSTILRLAGSLERSGYLVRAENGVFRLGPAVGGAGVSHRPRV